MSSVSARDWPPSLLVAARLVAFAVACATFYFGQAGQKEERRLLRLNALRRSLRRLLPRRRQRR